MGKKIIVIGLVVMLVMLPLVVSDSVWNGLTKGLADTLYCKINGDCNLHSLVVENLNITGNFNNVTVTNYNVTGNVTADNFFGWINWSWIQNSDVGVSNLLESWGYFNDTNDIYNFSSIQNWTDTECPSGQYAYGRQQDGSWKCREDKVNNGTVTSNSPFVNWTRTIVGGNVHMMFRT